MSILLRRSILSRVSPGRSISPLLHSACVSVCLCAARFGSTKRLWLRTWPTGPTQATSRTERERRIALEVCSPKVREGQKETYPNARRRAASGRRKRRMVPAWDMTPAGCELAQWPDDATMGTMAHGRPADTPPHAREHGRWRAQTPAAASAQTRAPGAGQFPFSHNTLS